MDSSESLPDGPDREEDQALPADVPDEEWDRVAPLVSKPPRLAVTRGAQWSRDSLRDFKVVGGKVVECDDTGDGNPDSEDLEVDL